ncbi:hypothetical protein [uncultured Deinococcus sp.]|uniref:hypothetical protein n=1 Tax=uncultured Deinococcus sp. TaxID=158789 RepID=UPI0025876CE4|nr:hypothetical protein [uncultured Deinococcus sp.]
MLRASFWLTALIFMPAGLFLYFLPPSVAALVGVSPLWLARFSGGLLLAWGAYQLAASFAPDAVKVGGLVGGNLLSVAALLPPTLREGALLAPSLRSVLLGLCAVLAALAVAATLTAPPRMGQGGRA